MRFLQTLAIALVAVFFLHLIDRPGESEAVPIVVGIAAMIVLFFVIVRREMAAVGEVGPSPVDCPRCEASPRTPDGWCAACTALLVSRPADPDHPIHRYLEVPRGDLDGLARCVADEVRVRLANGKQLDLSRGAWRRTLRFTRWVYPRLRSELLGLYVEPENVDVVWIHSHDHGPGRFGFHDLDLRVVIRFGFTHDLISEMVYSAALPGSAGRFGGHGPVDPPVDASKSVGPPPGR